jgi:large subunit ribosomal protein L15
MAGTGKRSDHRKTMILHEYGHDYFGKTGFHRPQILIKDIKTINVGELDKFKEENIDLKKLGYGKLLGKGNVDRKFKVVINKFSSQAKEKIEKAGGQILTG